jgi:hypothetical protein
MAKCFQLVGQGVPVRMSDADAFQVVVRDHDGQYCPKSVWKRERASAYRTKQGDNCIAKLVGDKISDTDTLHFNAQRKRYA